jgi:5-methylcytosine-specific restriction protein A
MQVGKVEKKTVTWSCESERPKIGRNMKSRLGRNKVFELLGAKPTNPRWAWCALSSDHRRAVFTLWEDQMTGGYSQLSWDEIAKSRGGSDQKRVLELVIAKKIPAFGLVCVAKSTTAEKRKIKEIKADYLVRLQIEKDGTEIYGKHCGQVLMAEVVRDIGKPSNSANDGLRDLESAPLGNESPDRAVVSSLVVVRDPKVRAYVLKGAAGCCEYCGKLGFLMSNGKRYLEAHHIIALGDQGKDTVENVIALCPEHHREAHYGKDAEALEMKFIKCIKKRQRKLSSQTG